MVEYVYWRVRIPGATILPFVDLKEFVMRHVNSDQFTEPQNLPVAGTIHVTAFAKVFVGAFTADPAVGQNAVRRNLDPEELLQLQSMDVDKPHLVDRSERLAEVAKRRLKMSKSKPLAARPYRTVQ